MIIHPLQVQSTKRSVDYKCVSYVSSTGGFDSGGCCIETNKSDKKRKNDERSKTLRRRCKRKEEKINILSYK
jgi:hypothetical protein